MASLRPISIGGVPVESLWAGLAPTAAGLFQVACKVPASAPSGDLELVLTQDGVAANRVTVAVARWRGSSRRGIREVRRRRNECISACDDGRDIAPDMW